jgi:ribose 5-phosphate isomerase B
MYAGALALGSDHAGYELKEAIKTFLEAREIPFKDFGCFNTDSVDYPDFAADVARSIQKGECLQGVLCCGSGVGVAIAANRFPGVRAVPCVDAHTATMSRRHNDANVICFGGRMIAPEYAQELLEIFINTSFDGGRHQRRVEKLDTVYQGDPMQC